MRKNEERRPIRSQESQYRAGFWESDDENETQHRLGSAVLDDDCLMRVYRELYEEDTQIRAECLTAYKEMIHVPVAEAERRILVHQGPEGKIDRRAPPNPIHSPRLGRFARKRSKVGKEQKIKDPALRNNPLRGRLVLTLTSTFGLIFIFLQALVHNKYTEGTFHTSMSLNSMIGPHPATLFDLGGLNTNLIRQGATYRLFWSMWMHSGWVHIMLNLACQMQYLYMFEPDWGFFRTFLLYMVSGLTGNALSTVADPCVTTVGSSGALFGLMGGTIPYCCEFWHSIPRPLCIIFFSISVMAVSFLLGFSGSTDNWAHMGGAIGGLCFGFGTIATLQIFQKEVAPKKRIKKAGLFRRFQQSCDATCKCGIREWIARAIGLGLLIATWSGCMYFLYVNPEFQPPGHVSFYGITRCCCCRPFPEQPVICEPCDMLPQHQVCTGEDPWKKNPNAARMASLPSIVSSILDDDAHPSLDAIDHSLKELLTISLAT